MRDALVTGITLDIFNRHADKLAMCNVAQLVNCIHTPFLALEDHFAATTIFHAFDMYKSHKGGQSLRFVSDAPAISFGANKSFWGLAGSASLRGKALVITVVNPHVSEPRTAEVSLRGASARSCNVTVLASADIHAHNDFENPHAVEPERQPASITGSSFVWTFKPASLTKLEIDLV
jgi:alpha-N-arabinofuranosidase